MPILLIGVLETCELKEWFIDPSRWSNQYKRNTEEKTHFFLWKIGFTWYFDMCWGMITKRAADDGHLKPGGDAWCRRHEVDQIFGHSIGSCKVICILVESYTENGNRIFRYICLKFLYMVGGKVKEQNLKDH